MQENFFIALEKVSNPAWVQGLASSGKKLNYAEMTEKVFEKLNLGIEMNDVLEDLKPVQSGMGVDMGGEMIGGEVGEFNEGAAGGIGAIPPEGGGLPGNGQVPGMGMG